MCTKSATKDLAHYLVPWFDTLIFVFFLVSKRPAGLQKMAMLAVVSKSVTSGPKELGGGSSESGKTAKAVDLLNHFSASNPHCISINIRDVSALSYLPSSTTTNAFHFHQHVSALRSLAVEDGVYCMFAGMMDNPGRVRKEYGLTGKAKQESSIVIEIYKTMRDRGPFPPHQILSQLAGSFSFLLVDSTSRTFFAAAAASSSDIPFFWGKTTDGCLAFSDDAGLLKKGCPKSFAPFPKGCFFSSAGGLHSYEHPYKEMKPVPRIDSQGQLCGASFKAADQVSKSSTLGIPRVGSEANWASTF